MNVTDAVAELVAAALGFEEILDALDAIAPPLQDGDDVAAFFHGDDARTLLFVHPDEERATLCAAGAAVVRPVSARVCSCKECMPSRFLESVAVASEFVGRTFVQSSEVCVSTFEFLVASEALEALPEIGLDFSAVLIVNECRKRKYAD